jgi:prepilin-type N-terminal cleavage/methylation domain-containing protein
MEALTAVKTAMFCRWKRGRLKGMTLVELLVALAIVALLVGLLLPALQATREAARATACCNHLRQIALATEQFRTTRRAFPPARIVGGPEEPELASTGPTWLFRVLPWLEETKAHENWAPGQAYAGQSASIRDLVVPVFLCPSRRSVATARLPAGESPPAFAPCGCIIPGRSVPGGGLSDFAGNHGDLSPPAGSPEGDFSQPGRGSGTIISSRGHAESSRWLDRVTSKDVSDGFSHTLLAGELHVRRPALLTLPDSGPAFDGTSFHHASRVGGPGGPIAFGPDDDVAGMALYVFGSWHPGACHFAFTDGRIVSLSLALDPQILGWLCNRHDGLAAGH